MTFDLQKKRDALLKVRENLRHKGEERMSNTTRIGTTVAGALLGVLFVTGCATEKCAPQSSTLDGLLLHYSFDKDESAGISDNSGNGNVGIVRGAKYSPDGKAGGAYQVGSKVGYIETPDKMIRSFDGTSFTIAFWFKANAHFGGQQMFIAQDEGGGSKPKWAFMTSHGSLTFHVVNPSLAGAWIAATPWVPQIDKWYHLAVTRSANTYSIYVDGVCVASQTNLMPIPAINAPLTIGQGENLYVEGLVDELMVFKRALSKLEIKKLSDAAN